MNRLFAISANTFLQTVRQPIYAILLLTALGSFTIAPSLVGWTLDDDNKLLRDIGLSTLLVQGVFLAAFSAAAVISTEIEQKTVLTSVAKPVSRWMFVVGKYVGVTLAIAVAHYVSSIAFLMCIRHGVLQTASEKPDVTVLVLGPGVVILMLIAAALLNYLFDWKFLPTSVALIVPALSISMLVLSQVDRDWKLGRTEIVQQLDRLPDEITAVDLLRGIIEFRPTPGQPALPGSSGELVRKTWKGPITDAERDYLRGLSDVYKWRQQVDFLIAETRKLTTPDLLKASLLIMLALSLLCGVALAGSTRMGTVPTLLLTIAALCVGLVTDHYLLPLDTAGETWAKVLYRVLPNFQFFWMIDALSDDRVIPWSYVGSVAGYTAVYVAALVALAAALFETREVG